MNPFIGFDIDHNVVFFVSLDSRSNKLSNNYRVLKSPASDDDLRVMLTWLCISSDHLKLEELILYIAKNSLDRVVFRPDFNSYGWSLILALRAITNDWDFINRFMRVYTSIK